MKRPSISFGFSLVELLVVVSIVSILSAVMYFNISEGSAQARDVERKADLRELQSALEQYKLKNGRYPARCANSQSWSGQSGTLYACNTGNEYIVGLAPEFIPRLPFDNHLPDGVNDSGYIYTVNSDGTVYKIMAKKTVESEVVTRDHLFASCAISNSGGVPCDPPGGPGVLCDKAICDRIQNSNSYNGTVSKPNECDPSNAQFRSSYGVWAGYATPGSFFVPGTEGYTANQERLTEAVACRI